MNKDFLKTPSYLLIIILVFNFIVFFPFGSYKVKAGFWESNKGSITTVLKGILMLWIMNLISKNTGGDSNEDLLTSTIKKGLNIDDNPEKSGNTGDNSENKNDNNLTQTNSKENSNNTLETNGNIESNNSQKKSENKTTGKTVSEIEITSENRDNSSFNESNEMSSGTSAEKEMLNLINQERKNQAFINNFRLKRGQDFDGKTFKVLCEA